MVGDHNPAIAFPCAFTAFQRLLKIGGPFSTVFATREAAAAACVEKGMGLCRKAELVGHS